ncbi:unnamed protein product, partial [Prorocentrum cordatum]
WGQPGAGPLRAPPGPRAARPAARLRPAVHPGRAAADALWCGRLFLHCRRVALRDAAGAPFAAEAPLPPDLAAALGRLRRLPGEGAEKRRVPSRSAARESDPSPQ